jgi:hypothetical protein
MAESDDALSRFRSLVGAKKPGPAQPPADLKSPAVTPEGPESYEAYEAFENEIRTTNVEIRCNRSGLSYFVEYAQMSPIVFDFRGAKGIFFSAGGYGFTIKGTVLRPIIRALRLRTCSTIQEFNPDLHIDAQPLDPTAPFVESIEVEVLRPPRPGDGAKA